ncbi:SWIM zinc finger protein [Emericellopsis atlantica]|uniref:SWIM zinc finger protein n=1 Tax=Emericellopsis atlantica TaxID=2614577 RepID=A0A9P7ZTS5_9HYPO|nr:SWIM zinc finger protein [Emericellopsis atlantica]KAG9258218.1 SWIM zinc finger protein [Emericellopsis atlantica]
MGGVGATTTLPQTLRPMSKRAQEVAEAMRLEAIRATRARKQAVALEQQQKSTSAKQGSRKAPIDLTGNDGNQKPTNSKRKATSQPSSSSSSKSTAKSAPSHKGPLDPPPTKKRKKDEEKRPGRFRPQPPQSFYDIYDRAIAQRFFVLSRARTGSEEYPAEMVELTGSTGNIYTVIIDNRPTCTCPHASKGKQCKHILFVMKKVLNAPFNLVYQLGLLNSELHAILAGAPPIEDPEVEQEQQSDKRKPIDGDCPICFSELEEKGEAIVWCRAACGQNIHKQCFDTWARTKGGSGKVTCPMCRSQWEGPDVRGLNKIRRDKGIESEGYINVADQLGISRERDNSSYSEWLGRPRYGGGGWSRGGRDRNGRW